jgi:hypothetical protein
MTRILPPTGHLWRPLPLCLRAGERFSPDRYTYYGGWDIYAAGLPAASGLAALACVTPEVSPAGATAR